MPKSKIYTAEFKESAVKLAVESDQSIRKTAKELGVKESTLHTWIAKNIILLAQNHSIDKLRNCHEITSRFST